ncbi:MAG: L-amino acid N-acyltransferase YncA [Myxococcota bacterium]|jgi:L-amino acid N-acyltransferase YncA
MPPLQQSIRDQWLDCAAREARATLSIQSPQTLRSNLTVWLDRECLRVTDSRFGERFAAGCPIPGAVPADYQQRILALPGLGASLLGIRFIGGDTDQPFIDLLAWSQLPTDWRPAIAAISEHFALFEPRSVRVLLAEPPPMPAAEPDQLWLAARLSTVRSSTPPPLEVEAGGPEDAAGVAAAIAAARAAAPELSDHLSPASAAELGECEAVVRLRRDGVWAGLAAARSGQQWALFGYEVVEEVLAPEARGQGLGPRLQRALAAALPAEPDLPLFGTIHAKNAPSLATARRCGREVVGGWWFIPADRQTTG